MNALNKLKELRSKGFRVEARGPSVLLFRPTRNSKMPDAGEAFEILRVSTQCGPWDNERDAKEFAGKLARIIGDLAE